MQVFIVTFEGPGSGGFNWFYKSEDAQRNYQEECETYDPFEEKTRIALFSMNVPDNLDRDQITDYLERNDVYGESDKAETTKVVGGKTPA